METPLFTELGLSDPVLKGIQKLGFERPSPIQARAIPVALEGRDILGISQTGSGKTAAFGLPLLESIDLKSRTPQAIVLCPTRELAVQICEDIHKLGAGLRNLQAIPVYGGAPIDRQIKALKQGVHLIVGTPGRVVDLLKRRIIKTEAMRLVVLDEADRMMDMGFSEEMEMVLSQVPEDRQTLFFTATMNRNIERLIGNYAQDPEYIEIETKSRTVDSIEQTYYEVRNRSKIEVLSRLLDIEPPRLAIVFCNTKSMVDDCTEALVNRGYAAACIHGDIAQNNRERILKRFREGKVEILVATDVAARGLDVDDIDAVFNYDLPQDPEDYVHRIGRTGRAGRSGRAVSFIFGKDVYRLQAIERYAKHKIKRVRIPTQEDITGQRAHSLFNKLRERLEKNDYTKHEDLVDRLLDLGHTPTDISGALFTLLGENNSREVETIAEDANPDERLTPPADGRGGRGNRFRGGRRDGRSSGGGGNGGGKRRERDGCGGKGKPTLRSKGFKGGGKANGDRPPKKDGGFRKRKKDGGKGKAKA